ncbi:MAG: elongation factor G [Thermodesulfobacteriota bacterium]|nr:elongation factor G [Thermodesulfobacteriota bacterium]
MAAYNINEKRNVAFVGHGGAGKTTLIEALLFLTKATDRLGSVDNKTSVMDYEPEEVKRNMTISTSFHHVEWNKHRINLVDTPGDANFFSDVRSCLQGIDSVVIVVDAPSGVKIQTERTFNLAVELGLPTIFFISKLDRERADYFATIENVRSMFKQKKIIPLQIPIGKEDSFNGIIDLVQKKAYIFDSSNPGKFAVEDIPSNMLDEVTSLRDSIIEDIAEVDDNLVEKYIEGEELTQEELYQGIKTGVQNNKFSIVLCGAPLKMIGTPQILDAIVNYMPSPEDKVVVKGIHPGEGHEISRTISYDEPFSALVFKTITDPYTGRLNIFRVFTGKISSDSTVLNLKKGEKEKIGQIFQLEGKGQKPFAEISGGDIAAVAKLKATVTGDTLVDEKAPIMFNFIQPPSPVLSYALIPKSRGDEDKVSASLSKILEEDLSLKVHRDEQTKEFVLSGMGQVHIEVALEKLKRKFGVEVDLRPPKVSYKETIKGTSKAQGKYKKQSGGRGQYGDTVIEMEPLQRGEGFQFVDKIVGGVIPKQYIPAVEKGIVEAMGDGVIAGYPVVDTKVSLVFGSFHVVDSSDMAFKIAGSMAFKKAVMEANPVLLEPIMDMDVYVPEDCMGDVIGDLNSKRGRVLGVEPSGTVQIIKAQVPQAEILLYAPDLSSITSDRGYFTLKFSHYEEVPANIAEKIIESANKDKKDV